mgnify:CR=1 FL=1
MAGVLDSVNQRTQLVGQNRLELLLFRLDGPQLYGINVFKVKEVLQCPKLTLMPKSHPVVCGVASIRGATIPILDLAMATGAGAVLNVVLNLLFIPSMKVNGAAGEANLQQDLYQPFIAALAANADSIWGIIAGRVLQGAGAISAAVMAMLSDLTREQHRTKAMAMIGMSIGLSFAVAMVVGPLLTRAFGLSGLFWATAGMALVGMLIIALFVPRASTTLQHRESGVARQALRPTLRNPELLRLNLGIGVLHAILMASFVALPLALVEEGGAAADEHHAGHAERQRQGRAP